MHLAALLAATLSPHAPAAAPGGPAARDAAPVWVFFADKGYESPAAAAGALERTAAAYNPRAVARRKARRTDPGLFDARDLPVAPAYVDAVAGTGARVRVESRWINAVSVRATPAQLERIRALPFVAKTQPVARGPRSEPSAGPAPLQPPGGVAAGFYGLAEEQLAQINLIDVHAQGFTGVGVVIGILDTGFVRTHAAFNHPSHPLAVVAEHDFVKGDGNTAPEPGDNPDQHYHGTLILGTLGAYKPDEFVGGAYDASFILCKTEDLDSETPVEEDYYVAGLEFIEANGGDVATASLIYIDWYTQQQLDGQTAVCTIGVNTATANGLFCCNAAGNFGHDSNPATSALGAPADAFQVITCGAVSGEGSITGFSSDGPTADGRIKPEVLARGADTFTVDPFSAGGYATASGTSLSTPLVASAVGCLVGARPAWTVDQLRTLVFTTASDFVANGEPDPLFVRGYGIVDAGAALAADCNANGVPDAEDISSGASGDCNRSGSPDECECMADFDASGTLDIDDFIAFQTGFAVGHPCADTDRSGVLDIDDFVTFQTLFAVGCP